MSRIPGSVVPGPFGSLTRLREVVGVELAEDVGDGKVEGAPEPDIVAAGKGALLSAVDVDRGNSGASWKTVTAKTHRPAIKITPIARRSPAGNG
jgi:hypothetical protein